MSSKKIHVVMFVFFSVLLCLFIGKMVTEKQVIKKIHIDVERSYEPPKTPEENKDIPEYKKAYYDHLYNN